MGMWARRADQAENAIVGRHLQPLWLLPGTALGVISWPPTMRDRMFVRWHYWWQAHLLDCMVDAAMRAPTPDRRRRIRARSRTHRIRNVGRWTNDYYDDMAWLGLALERAGRLDGVSRETAAIDALADELHEAWDHESGGGIPWRKEDDFFNTPANGPAAILLARLGKINRAEETMDWVHARLRDPDRGLIYDGVRGDGRFVTNIYTYCQGVVLGAETELALRAGDPRHSERVRELVAAVSQHLAPRGVIKTSGGGDGGLFPGILARYLAFVATRLPLTSEANQQARRLARGIVLRSAEAAWRNHLDAPAGPLFGANWAVPATYPDARSTPSKKRDGAVRASAVPERDLSVQLSGWMLLEAAAVCE
ncbi:fructose-bisphosphate aldolase [Hoyosella sp. G463]|uniref:Fructose-bisphosphate aldolase n=1 Tax=Lolliginicoccus lacisalsi TaxID=2742202 RepID=A0A927JDV3_9ACTN|nr:glycoside hydrolase family 76 protein [Lolliginicoccus lacisalsi]MBD8507434.1 fructose-bisphosphate aldolase [Lolliginicoccus lacisalsi]